jgi:hypothetical protein
MPGKIGSFSPAAIGAPLREVLLEVERAARPQFQSSLP